MEEISTRVKGNDGRMNLPILTISAKHGWMTQSKRFSTNIAGKEQKKYTLLKKEQLSYNHGNSKAAIYGTVFKLSDYDEALVPKVYHSFQVGNLNDATFVEQYFHTKKIDRQLRRFISSTARMDGLLNITFSDFMHVQFFIPKIKEQKNIALLLIKINHLISLQQRKLSLLEKIQKNFLENMLVNKPNKLPQVRFRKFTNVWTYKNLGEIATIQTGKLDANAMVPNGKYDFYTSGIKKYHIDIPAFVGPAITIAGNGATVGYMHLADGQFNAYQRTYVLSKLLANRIFIFYEVGHKLPRKIQQESRTGNIPYIVMGMLTELQLIIPDSNEQEKVGNLFENLNKLIEDQQVKLRQLSKIKKFFLQQMFI